jgi:tetratricopeptide (TPR) repeat protein
MPDKKIILASLFAFAVGGCATAGKPVEKGDEEPTAAGGGGGASAAAAKNETAPKPPAQVKKQPEQAAPKLSASAKSEFDGAVKKWTAAKEAKGGISPGDCKSLASNFSSIHDSQLAAQAHFNAGTILESCGYDKDAESEYQTALQANSGYAPALSNLGELYYKQGNPTTARMWFEKAIAADPTHASSAYANLAAIQFQQGKSSGDSSVYKEAITNARRALAIDNDLMAAYGVMALIYYTIAENDPSKLQLAELVCTKGLANDKDYAQLYNTLGLIKLRRKLVSEALRQFELAVQYDPKYIEAHLNIGAIGLSTRQYEKAAASFDAVLKLNPKSTETKVDAMLGMGVAARGLKKVDEAESWYKKVGEVDPKNCDIQYNLGVLYQDYKSTADNSNLNTAKDFFGKYRSCPSTKPEKVKDAERRMKDIDDTFVALAESKKMEAEAKAMQEEADRIQKQAEEQQKAQDAAAAKAGGDKGATAPAPAAGDKAAGDKAAGDKAATPAAPEKPSK